MSKLTVDMFKGMSGHYVFSSAHAAAIAAMGATDALAVGETAALAEARARGTVVNLRAAKAAAAYALVRNGIAVRTGAAALGMAAGPFSVYAAIGRWMVQNSLDLQHANLAILLADASLQNKAAQWRGLIEGEEYDARALSAALRELGVSAKALKVVRDDLALAGDWAEFDKSKGKGKASTVRNSNGSGDAGESGDAGDAGESGGSPDPVADIAAMLHSVGAAVAAADLSAEDAKSLRKIAAAIAARLAEAEVAASVA